MTTARVGENGLVISPEQIEPLGLRVGDSVEVVATSEGIQLKKIDAAVAEQLEVAKRVMEKRDDVLRRLAE
jgi:bifunctional DNA-binding transcriptional regulator/antitoxin component of YhaV-PrlF toxin-antitoxin module